MIDRVVNEMHATITHHKVGTAWMVTLKAARDRPQDQRVPAVREIVLFHRIDWDAHARHWKVRDEGSVPNVVRWNRFTAQYRFAQPVFDLLDLDRLFKATKHASERSVLYSAAVPERSEVTTLAAPIVRRRFVVRTERTVVGMRGAHRTGIREHGAVGRIMAWRVPAFGQDRVT